MSRALSAAHDIVTVAGFRLAAFLLGLIAVSFCYEVGARYLFDAPTSWANAFVSYFLCAAIFLAVPELTRRHAHVAINILLDRAPPRLARAMQHCVRALSALACFFATWFSANEAWNQFQQEITTMSAYPIPKWWVSIFIPYGMLGAGLYFLRQFAEARPPAHASGAAP